jgi:WD40 repeat protein/energy-coupling factor transporter ATP-binding protein EcfA2
MSEMEDRTLGRYQIVSLLGWGGMGEVYKAYQPGLDRYVAIKVLHSHLAEEAGFVGRFEREAASVARLRHPNIVQVIDFDCQDDQYYMVMEFIDGPTLRQEEEERGEHFEIEKAAYVISGVASGLDYAHGRGMVHRDVKPGNILFTEEGQVVLTDFGIAHIVGTTLYTESGGMLGTPAYMAPEQGRGEMGDARSDIYSLGVVLYEMVTGRLPYEADTPLGMIQQHIEALPSSPSSINPDLPEAIEVVILKALAKNPEARYQSAGEMAGALLDAVELDLEQVIGLGGIPVVLEEVGEGEVEERPLPPCPYRGLFTFREEDAPFFFGREAFTDRLVAAVEEKSLVGVIGPSGSGKSSVVFAGLLPHLRQAFELRGSQGRAWLISVCRPGANPFYSLGTALMPQLEGDVSDTARLVGTQKMAVGLREGELTLQEVCEQVLEEREQYGRLLLVIDQFEELFTLCQDDKERRRFMDVLLEGIESGSPLRLVLTIRADFLGQALSHRSFADALQDADLILGPMTRGELSQAVENPARKQGIGFEVGLVDRILDDVGDEPGHLPLLEFALTQLWEEQKVGQLSHEAYEAIGRVDGALARYADQVFARLEEPQQVRARRVFTQMVWPGEGTEDTRRLAHRDELGEGDWVLVQSLADTRLVITDLDVTNEQETVEVVHEALIHNWGQLRGWMDEDRAFRSWQERMRAALRGWMASRGDEGALLRGGPLVEAEGWLEEREAELSELERTFIKDSIALRERQQAKRERRRRWIILVLTCGMIITLVLAYVAYQQSQAAQTQAGIADENAATATYAQGQAQFEAATAVAAQEQEAAQRATAQAEAIARTTAEADALNQREDALRQASVGLAAQAELQMDSPNQERAVLLALEAVENYPYTWQAEHALGQAVVEHNLLLDLNHGAWVNRASPSPGGTRILTAGDDGVLRVWDAVSGEELLTIIAHEATGTSATWSPAGDRILSSSFDGVAKVWDATTGEELLALPDHGGFGAKWSPDGTRILSQYSREQDSVLVWDADSGEVLFELPGDVGLVKFAFWSPDGTRIASSTGKVWDGETGQQLLTLPGYQDRITAQSQLLMAWSPDGIRIAASLQGEGEGRVWDAATGRVLYTLDGHAAHFFSFWSPSGDRILTVGRDGQAKIWDAETGDELHSLLGVDITGTFNSAAWSPDGTRILTSGDPGWIKVWDSATGSELLALRAHSGDVGFKLWPPEGDRVITTGTDGSAKVWDFSSVHLPLGCQPDCTISPVGGWYTNAAWSPSGDQAARGFYNSTVMVWDVGTGDDALSLQYETDAEHFLASGVVSVEWSPSGDKILTASNDGITRIWDATTGEGLYQLSVNKNAFNIKLPTLASWSSDGKRITTWNSLVEVWDTDTLTVTLTFTEHNPYSVSWSPDGSRILSTDEYSKIGSAKVWDPDTGEVMLDLFPAGFAFGVPTGSWSPDGTRIVTFSEDKLGRIWDGETGEELLSFTGVSGGDYAMWSPSGERILVAGLSGRVIVYDADTGDELLSYAIGSPSAASWSPDGKYIAVSDGDGNLLMFPAWQALDELVDYAYDCCVFRELSPEERAMFGLPE